MHQPFYEDLVTHEHILPWVRLHALKDYYGMVALLREFPDVRVTFNLVPSLLVQLEDFADDRARDRSLELSLKPAAELNDADIAFVVANFFHAQRQRMIDVYPRYARTARRRARGVGDSSRPTTCATSRCGTSWPGSTRPISTLTAASAACSRRRRDFSEDDKALLGTVELELLNRVIPEYRDAVARGQIEVSTSPVLPPDSAAPVRHRHLPADAPAARPCRGGGFSIRRTRTSS